MERTAAVSDGPDESKLDEIRALLERELKRILEGLGSATAAPERALYTEQMLCTKMVTVVALESCRHSFDAMARVGEQQRLADRQIARWGERGEELIADLKAALAAKRDAEERAKDPELPDVVREMTLANVELAEHSVQLVRSNIEYHELQPDAIRILIDSNESMLRMLGQWNERVLDDLRLLYGNWERNVRRDAWRGLAWDFLSFGGGLGSLLLSALSRRIPDIIDPRSAVPPEGRLGKEWQREREKLIGHYGWCMSELDGIVLLERLAAGESAPMDLLLNKARTGELLYPDEVIKRMRDLLSSPPPSEDGEPS